MVGYIYTFEDLKKGGLSVPFTKESMNFGGQSGINKKKGRILVAVSNQLGMSGVFYMKSDAGAYTLPLLYPIKRPVLQKDTSFVVPDYLDHDFRLALTSEQKKNFRFKTEALNRKYALLREESVINDNSIQFVSFVNKDDLTAILLTDNKEIPIKKQYLNFQKLNKTPINHIYHLVDSSSLIYSTLKYSKISESSYLYQLNSDSLLDSKKYYKIKLMESKYVEPETFTETPDSFYQQLWHVKDDVPVDGNNTFYIKGLNSVKPVFQANIISELNQNFLYEFDELIGIYSDKVEASPFYSTKRSSNSHAISKNKPILHYHKRKIAQINYLGVDLRAIIYSPEWETTGKQHYLYDKQQKKTEVKYFNKLYYKMGENDVIQPDSLMIEINPSVGGKSGNIYMAENVSALNGDDQELVDLQNQLDGSLGQLGDSQGQLDASQDQLAELRKYVFPIFALIVTFAKAI